MGDASIVHVSILALSREAPTRLVFHHWSNRDWRRTRCGRPYETSGQRLMVAVRRDTAYLIADPCRICYRYEDWP